MATRLLLHKGSTFRKSLTTSAMTSTPSTSSNQQRRRPGRRNAPTSGDSSNATQQHTRPPKHLHAQRQQSSTPRRPTHFLALPLGHHAGLRSAVQGLTTSWLAHDPPIDGLDPSIVVQPRRLHLTLGVMTLAAEQDEENTHSLAGATQLLAELAPRVRAALGRAPLRVPLGRLAVMQPDPTRAHVLYAEPDLSSADGRRLRAVCGMLFSPCYLHHPFQTNHSRTCPGCIYRGGFSHCRASPAQGTLMRSL